MGKKDNSSNEPGMIGKIVGITLLALLIIVAIGFVIGLFFLGFAGLFKLVGVYYESNFTLLLFVLLLFVIGFITDLISKALIHIFTDYLSNERLAFFIKAVIDISFSWFAIFAVDEWMDSITIPTITELIAAMILFFLDEAVDHKKAKE